ncbi:cyclic nucleotide-binding domain-containing protein (plasmid) [Escherichia coli]|nr:cyclic nucleotide-binding domain-containing protein [Escherichia coli]MDS1493575.1 cyclic nucleotide-binding domain-containing protein [Escherichia coli]
MKLFMQLKPLTKGRFHNIWQQNDAFIEKTFRELLSETQLIHEGDYLFRQGQVVDRLIMVETGRISLSYSAENGRCFQFGTMDCDEQLFGEMEFFTGYWICPYISRHLLSLNPLQARCRRYSRGER